MSLVWLKTPESEETAFVPANILSKDGEKVEIKLTSGEVRKVHVSETRQRFERGDGATASDNTALVFMNDASLLDNLQARHKKDEIYTYTASVLLAVNPYRNISGLYGDAQCKLYRGKHIGALAPHPYAIADTAYRTLVREKLNQALLISGESGAGKTETAKIVMEYLAFASGTTSDLAAQIQARVLQAQPILESFGNSVTLRNSNSSRFGKYNRVYFDNEGTLVDAGMQTYLLESSRVVGHGEKERTYHVFYEMLQGLTEDKLKAFHLDKTKQYRLVHNEGKSAKDFEDRDKANFTRLCSALETVGQDKKSIEDCFQVIAGLVHLGDIPIQDAEVEMAARAKVDDAEADTRTVEVNEESVAHAAALLGFDQDELCGVLKRKRIAIPGRSSMHEVARNPLQFRQALHSLIKALYKRLFELTVRRINDSFKELRPAQAAEEAAEWSSIGILDIYGFERLQRNSFEQLCINLANERLQQYFVENVLVAEQALYQREGLPWTGLTLPNSDPVVQCISHVFKSLDDFSSRQAKGFGESQACSDDHFCERVLKECAQNKDHKDILKAIKISAKDARNSKGPKANEFFVITHYAGTVDYCTKGWLDKNNDRLLAECESLICESTFPLVQSLGEEDSKQPFRSISSKYQKDLEALLKTLGDAHAHYIRCFKPNALQKPEVWNGPLVLDQIVQCGTIELVKIMHDGFPNRCQFEELCNRFKALLPEKFQRYGQRTFIEALMLAYEVPESEWALGMTRLFLKAGQLKALEDMREEGAVPNSETLDRIVKMIIRKRWTRAVHAVKLCNWLPKFMRKIYVDKAAVKLSAVARVTSCIAPKLEAAKKRVADRKEFMRRRLAGVFRTVFCMNRAFREIKQKRRERALNALYLGSFIVMHVKPWTERARLYLRDAEVRRAQEEERRRQEMERKLKEEEEALRLRLETERKEAEDRLQLEAEKRRQEEEEQAEKRRKEEEERINGEAEKRRLEEEARKQEEEALTAKRQQEEAERSAEMEREREEARKKMEEDKEQMKKQMKEDMQAELAAEKQRMKEEMTKELDAVKQQATEKLRAELEAEAAVKMEEKEKLLVEKSKEIDEMKETVRQARLSQSMATSTVTSSVLENDVESDIGDSVSVANQPLINSMSSQVQEAVKQQTEAAMKVLREEVLSEGLAVREQMTALVEKNQALEQREQEWLEENNQGAKSGAASEVSQIELSPPANGTPLYQQPRDPSPLSNISAISGSPATPGGARGARTYSLIQKEGTARRNSVAKDAMSSQYFSKEAGSAGRSLPANGNSMAAEQQRKWWAEQRSSLMDDLFPMGGAPTPARNTSKRISQDGGASNLPELPAPRPVQASLASEFDAADQDEDGLRSRGKGKDAGNVEWMESVPDTKMRVPQVHSKKTSKGYSYNNSR